MSLKIKCHMYDENKSKKKCNEDNNTKSPWCAMVGMINTTLNQSQKLKIFPEFNSSHTI